MTQGQDFEGDLCGIFASYYERSSCIEMRGITTVNPGAVLASLVGSLLVDTVWINYLEEVFNQPGDRYLLGVKANANAFYVAVIAAFKCLVGSIGSAGFGGVHSGEVTHKFLNAPEAPSG
jgi:hypothetical protein